LIALNFNTINLRVCKGLSKAGKQASDYEIYVPSHTSCIMGRKTYLIRRKRDSRCWDDQDIEKEHFVKMCPCTNEDWECDYGFRPVMLP